MKWYSRLIRTISRIASLLAIWEVEGTFLIFLVKITTYSTWSYINYLYLRFKLWEYISSKRGFPPFRLHIILKRVSIIFILFFCLSDLLVNCYCALHSDGQFKADKYRQGEKKMRVLDIYMWVERWVEWEEIGRHWR